MVMDVNPARIRNFTINGDIFLDDEKVQNVHIAAESIWIRAGSLKSGLNSDAFNGTITIELLGNKNDPGGLYSS